MIEFKAECGHTIRASEEDAGGVAQCSYCGREALVPHPKDNNLDFLYSDVERGVSEPTAPSVGRPQRGRKGRARARKHRGPTEANPFQIVLYMCYAAVLFVIVVLVGKEYVLPLFQKEGVIKRLANAPDRKTDSGVGQDGSPVVPQQPRRRVLAPGLINVGVCTGIYFASIPARADVFVLPVDDAPTTGTIRDIPGCERTVAGGQWERKWKGEFVVEVSLPWSHSELMDPTLPFASQYVAFRRAIHKGSDEDRRTEVAQFFVPDGASDTFVYETSPDQLEIVRQYRGIQVDDGSFAAVRAIFLPGDRSDGPKAFRVGDLIDHYLPKTPSYSFDNEYVRRELVFWGVPSADHGDVITALEHIGVIPFATPDGIARLFMIDVCDGQVTTKECVDVLE